MCGSAYDYKDETLVGPVVRPRRVLRGSRNSGYPRAAPTPSASRHAIRRRRTGWTGSACMRPPVPNRDRPSRPSRMMRIGTSVARRMPTGTPTSQPDPGSGATDRPVDRDAGVRFRTPEPPAVVPFGTGGEPQLSHLRHLKPSPVPPSRSLMCGYELIYNQEAWWIGSSVSRGIHRDMIPRDPASRPVGPAPPRWWGM